MQNTNNQGFGWFLEIGIAIGCVYVLSGNSAVAQITPDGTLPNNSRVTTQNNIRIIEGGTQAGSNLFHSFREFSVPTNSTAFFNNGMEIQNIISRITGESVSNIDGLIRANGTANLFVINPHGIIFGPNAQLNIGGSFFASTASAIKFFDGFEFSATAPSSTPLLTISVPIGLQFGAKPESIRNQSQVTDSSGVPVGLQVQPGKTLALVGGGVNLDSGNLQASGGRVELGGLASAGTVGLNGDGKNLSLSFPNDVGLADISLTNSKVDVLAGGGGSIGINARNFDVLPGSIILAGIKTGMGAVGSQAGDITINATGKITISGLAIVNAVQTMGVGNGGDINIRTDSLSINKGAQIYMGALGQGNAGNLKINAQNQVLLDGGLVINSVGEGVVGNAGNINITTGSLAVRNGGQLNANTLGNGNAGSVTINAKDRVSFDGPSSGVITTVASKALGNGGNINITTGSLFFTNGAQLNANTQGNGNAGSVTINAKDQASFDGVSSTGDAASAVLTTVGPQAAGKGGGIDITTGSLSLTNGGQLIANTQGHGNAGSVTINANNRVSVDGVSPTGKASAILTTVESQAIGKGGGIDITTDSLSVRNGGQLIANTQGNGNAGSVTINAKDQVSFDGVGPTGEASAVLTTVGPQAVGRGGGIDITTGSLSVRNGGQLIANTQGKENAGSVTINANNRVLVDGVGSTGKASAVLTTVDSQAMGKGGDINITTGSLSVRNGGLLEASTFGKGDAGSITINAKDQVSLDGVTNNGALSSVLTTVASGSVGNGGNINVTAGSLSLTNGARLAANTEGNGNSGNIQVTAANSVSVSGVSSTAGFSSGLFTSTEPGAVGEGGKITLNAPSLQLQDGAIVNAQTLNAYNGGNVMINANTLKATGGGQVLTTTSGSGKAGEITINATDSITLAGRDPTFASRSAKFVGIVRNQSPATGLFSNADANSTGNGGSINLNTNKLNISDQAGISVNSSGKGNAGNLQIQAADSLNLDQQAFLSAATVSGKGGNIELQIGSLLLTRHNSQISAKADANGDGGNITINAPLIVAIPQENSDIVANALKGRGGNIQITTQGVFGLQSRPSLTPESDINASSQFGVNGTVQINTPDVDPSRGLVALPTQVDDASSKLIASSCAAFNEKTGSTFVVTGRGGLPPSPDEPLSSDVVWEDTRLSATTTQQHVTKTQTTKLPSKTDAVAIVPATGWVFNNKGEVTLISSAPEATGSMFNPTSCSAR